MKTLVIPFTFLLITMISFIGYMIAVVILVPAAVFMWAGQALTWTASVLVGVACWLEERTSPN